MVLAGLVTYACKELKLQYDVHVALFISPIVFPLAFSINTDFQRREKVLEDLAIFKSSAMMWFFCMRDWREAASKYAQNYFLLKVMDVYEHINAVLDFLNTR